MRSLAAVFVIVFVRRVSVRSTTAWMIVAEMWPTNVRGGYVGVMRSVPRGDLVGMEMAYAQDQSLDQVPSRQSNREESA